LLVRVDVTFRLSKKFGAGIVKTSTLFNQHVINIHQNDFENEHVCSIKGVPRRPIHMAHPHTHTDTHTRTYTHIHTDMNTHTHADTHIHTHTHKYTNTHTHTHTQIHTHTTDTHTCTQ